MPFETEIHTHVYETLLCAVSIRYDEEFCAVMLDIRRTAATASIDRTAAA